MSYKKQNNQQGKVKTQLRSILQETFRGSSEEVLVQALHYAENRDEYEAEISQRKSLLIKFISSSFDPALLEPSFLHAQKTKLKMLEARRLDIQKKLQTFKDENNSRSRLGKLFSKESEGERHIKIDEERHRECSSIIAGFSLSDLGNTYHPNTFFKENLEDLSSKFTWFLEKATGQALKHGLAPLFKGLDSLWVELEGRSETFTDSPQRTETGEKFRLNVGPDITNLLNGGLIKVSLNESVYRFSVDQILKYEQATSVEYLKVRLLEIKRRNRELNLRALARESTETQRSVSGGLRTVLEYQKQINSFADCPYCGNKLGEYSGADACHFDHIHPVSKGGLSTPQNMLFVCANCNMKKSDKTLNRFIEDQKFDNNFIFKTLKLLNKDY